MIDFTDQVVIVTGAGQGLGRSHALAFAARGAKVLVNDPGRDGEISTAERVAEEIGAAGGTALANTAAVGEPGPSAGIVRAASERWGRVDAVVNNAGFIRDASIGKLDAGAIESVVRVHLLGALYVAQAAFAVMREQEHGRLVFTSSAAGLFGNFGQANYSSAKMGLVGLARTLAQEGSRKNIRSNAVAPGAATAMTATLLENAGDLRERLRPELVTPLVVYLCSRDCEPTGEVFTAAAGHFARAFVAETPGIDLTDPTPEDIASGLEQISAEEGYVVPGSLADEMALWMPDLSSG